VAVAGGPEQTPSLIYSIFGNTCRFGATSDERTNDGVVVLASSLGYFREHDGTRTLIGTKSSNGWQKNLKIQRVERGTTKSYHVNIPAALAEAAPIEKGEKMEWLVENRSTFVLRRTKPKKSVVKGKTALT
jgi:antitoxin component of MazEF toxin-antitoxin module